MFNQTIVIVRAAALAEQSGSSAVQRDWANATRTTVAGVNLQPKRSVDSGDSSGVDASGQWELFSRWAGGKLDILATDRVEYDGMVFEVDGFPEHWPAPGGGWHHTEVALVVEPLYRAGAQGTAASAARTAATGAASREWSPR